MGDLSTHFSRREFACRCGCGYDTVDTVLLEVLEGVRQHFGAAITINSACRCAARNKAVGGSPKSQHLLGRAADISVRDVSPTTVANWVESNYPGRLGVGRYLNFVHIDSRNAAARWSQ